MYGLIYDLADFFGLTVMPLTIGDFLSWFVMMLFGIEFVLFVFDSIFFTIRQINKGVR